MNGSGKGQNTKHLVESRLFGWARSSDPIKANGYQDKVHDLRGGHSPMRRCWVFANLCRIDPIVVPVRLQASLLPPLTRKELVHIKGLFSFQHEVNSPPQLLGKIRD